MSVSVLNVVKSCHIYLFFPCFGHIMMVMVQSIQSGACLIYRLCFAFIRLAHGQVESGVQQGLCLIHLPSGISGTVDRKLTPEATIKLDIFMLSDHFCVK